MATPSEVLRKVKKTDKKDAPKKGGSTEDEHHTSEKSGKRSALIDFIAKHKKAE
jgi:hypothetical protein